MEGRANCKVDEDEGAAWQGASERRVEAERAGSGDRDGSLGTE